MTVIIIYYHFTGPNTKLYEQPLVLTLSSDCQLLL